MQNLTEEKYKELFKAFLSLENADEVRDFCIDLMTPKEIEAFADRLLVAKELYSGKSQRDISKVTGVSIATVTRVNRFLKNGANGYKTFLEKHHHNH